MGYPWRIEGYTLAKSVPDTVLNFREELNPSFERFACAWRRCKDLIHTSVFLDIADYPSGVDGRLKWLCGVQRKDIIYSIVS